MAQIGAKPGVSAAAANRAERLVRALTGVADACVDAAPNGRITGVFVIPEAGFSPNRVIQNVRSALMATTGIALEAGRVYIVKTLPELPIAVPPADAPSAKPAVAPATAPAPYPAERVTRATCEPDAEPAAVAEADDVVELEWDVEAEPVHALQAVIDVEPVVEPQPLARIETVVAREPVADVEHVAAERVVQVEHVPAERVVNVEHVYDAAPHAFAPSRPDPLAPIVETPARPRQNGNHGIEPHPAPAQPAWPMFNQHGVMPRIELLEMQRDETGAPRCRIIIESDARRYLGTATNVRGGETTADLIAGAITHALEPIIPCDLHFDGMADVIIAGQRHVVVSLRNTSDWSHALSGAAPVYDSVEYAIANAILNAIGVGIAHTYSFMNRLVNHR